MSVAEHQEETIQYIRGYPFPKGMGFLRENIEASMDYKARDGDVVVSSYPKTGSTWLQYILWAILHKDKLDCSLPSFDDVTRSVMPFMELAGIDAIEKLPPPRTYKNHLPYHLNTINENAKYIYIHRNPKDTVVSFYHFISQLYDVEFTFDKFFQDFVDGKLSYGDYFDNALSFYEHRNDNNVLFLSYEKMQENRMGGILKIAEFLGPNYLEPLTSDEGLLEKILTVTSFDYMKKNLTLHKPPEETKQVTKKVNFFRKGIVGDGKTFLTEEQGEILLEKTLEKMDGTDLKDLWISYY